MLHLKYHLSEEEFFEYNYYTTWLAPDRKSYRVSYYLKFILLYGIIALIFIITGKNDGRWIDIVVYGGIASLYLLLVPWLVRRSVKRRARQFLSRPENQHVLSECEVILTDTGIVDKDKESESRYSWEAIVKTGETLNCHYLYTNSYHAIVIPKRTVKDPADLQELQRLMSTHLPLSTELN
jgi:hypothetical protein